ncbi:MAG: hypothetical protein ACLT0Y_05805 [Christensenellales bacterium]
MAKIKKEKKTALATVHAWVNGDAAEQPFLRNRPNPKNKGAKAQKAKGAAHRKNGWA